MRSTKTIGRRRVPWYVNPKVAARRAKVARLKRKGIDTSTTKAEARKACDAAVKQFIKTVR